MAPSTCPCRATISTISRTYRPPIGHCSRWLRPREPPATPARRAILEALDLAGRAVPLAQPALPATRALPVPAVPAARLALRDRLDIRDRLDQLVPEVIPAQRVLLPRLALREPRAGQVPPV